MIIISQDERCQCFNCKQYTTASNTIKQKIKHGLSHKMTTTQNIKPGNTD